MTKNKPKSNFWMDVGIVVLVLVVFGLWVAYVEYTENEKLRTDYLKELDLCYEDYEDYIDVIIWIINGHIPDIHPYQTQQLIKQFKFDGVVKLLSCSNYTEPKGRMGDFDAGLSRWPIMNAQGELTTEEDIVKENIIIAIREEVE